METELRGLSEDATILMAVADPELHKAVDRNLENLGLAALNISRNPSLMLAVPFLLAVVERSQLGEILWMDYLNNLGDSGPPVLCVERRGLLLPGTIPVGPSPEEITRGILIAKAMRDHLLKDG